MKETRLTLFIDTNFTNRVNGYENQTYPYWECIVVDNHSTDDIKGIIGSFKDYRIHYTKSEGNRYFARNAGMNIALHDWICWLDSDDEYESIYRRKDTY